MTTPLSADGRPLPIALADEREASRDDGQLLRWQVHEHIQQELRLLERHVDRQRERIVDLRARLREKAALA